MATFQTIINDARVILGDKVVEAGAELRYLDTELLRFALLGLEEIRRIRPDLFFADPFANFTTLGLTSTVPLPEVYSTPLTDWVVMRAEFRDDEYTVDGRAAAMRQFFKQALLGIA